MTGFILSWSNPLFCPSVADGRVQPCNQIKAETRNSTVIHKTDFSAVKKKKNSIYWISPHRKCGWVKFTGVLLQFYCTSPSCRRRRWTSVSCGVHSFRTVTHFTLLKTFVPLTADVCSRAEPVVCDRCKNILFFLGCRFTYFCSVAAEQVTSGELYCKAIMYVDDTSLCLIKNKSFQVALGVLHEFFLFSLTWLLLFISLCNICLISFYFLFITGLF